jgi:hypothetical protein
MYVTDTSWDYILSSGHLSQPLSTIDIGLDPSVPPGSPIRITVVGYNGNPSIVPLTITKDDTVIIKFNSANSNLFSSLFGFSGPANSILVALPPIHPSKPTTTDQSNLASNPSTVLQSLKVNAVGADVKLDFYNDDKALQGAVRDSIQLKALKGSVDIRSVELKGDIKVETEGQVELLDVAAHGVEVVTKAGTIFGEGLTILHQLKLQSESGGVTTHVGTPCYFARFPMYCSFSLFVCY